MYNPGPTWWRVDSRNWQVEPLTAEPVSPRFNFECYGLSAHFGLVAWNYGDLLHRVHVGSEATAKRDLRWIYPFVPEALRERHAQAVETIRRLGGSVDFVRITLAGNSVQYHKEWRSVVYLPESWQGGDDDLKHLTELDNLRELYLVGTPVTDNGLKTIGQLTDIEILHLEEIRCTDAGLAELKPLTKLQRLRIEGPLPQGEGFSDNGLATFQGHATLQSLTLSGRRFTNDCLPRVLDVPKLREVRFLDTAVTPDPSSTALA